MYRTTYTYTTKELEYVSHLKFDLAQLVSWAYPTLTKSNFDHIRHEYTNYEELYGKSFFKRDLFHSYLRDVIETAIKENFDAQKQEELYIESKNFIEKLDDLILFSLYNPTYIKKLRLKLEQAERFSLITNKELVTALFEPWKEVTDIPGYLYNKTFLPIETWYSEQESSIATDIKLDRLRIDAYKTCDTWLTKTFGDQRLRLDISNPVLSWAAAEIERDTNFQTLKHAA